MTTTRKSFGFRVYDAGLAQWVRNRSKETSVDTSDVVEQALRLLQDSVTKHEMDYLREHLPIQKNIDQDRSAFMQFPDDAPSAVGSTRGSFVVPSSPSVESFRLEEVTLDRPRRSSFRSRVSAAASASLRSGKTEALIADMNAVTKRIVDAPVDITPSDPTKKIEPVLRYKPVQRPKGPDSGPDEALGF